MIERLRWRFRLWAERTVERVSWTHRMIDLGAGSAIKGGTFDAFVDRLSPWVEHRGYRRTRLRRWLYRLRHSRRNFIQTVRGLIMVALASYKHHPGRYEGNDSQLIAEWLDSNSEWANETIGDTTEYGSWFALFTGSFPWGDANYIIQVTDDGFVSMYTQYDAEEVKVRWAAITAQYEFWASNNDADHEIDESYGGVNDEPLTESELRYQHGDK